MFPSIRQENLNPILQDLNKIEGLETIEQDDFNSNEIDIWITIKLKSKNPILFEHSLRSIKSRIRQVLNKSEINWRFTDFPVPTYEYIPAAWPFPSSKRATGYDQNRLGVAVSV